MRAVEAIGKLLLRGGRRRGPHRHPGRARGRARRPNWTRLLAGVSAEQLHLSAFHPTGTVALGADAQRARPTRRAGCAACTGVLVADGSALPGCPEVNPQLTIMATALAVTRAVAEASRITKRARVNRFGQIDAPCAR